MARKYRRAKARNLDFSILQIQIILDTKFQALAAILEILGVWVVGGGVLLQRSRNLEFWNPRPWISIYTKFQLSTIILKEFEKFLGVWVVGVVGGGVLLLQSQNLNFWNRRPWISLHTKFQVCTISLKIFEISGARNFRGPWSSC